jgi:hypothetical protein
VTGEPERAAAPAQTSSTADARRLVIPAAVAIIAVVAAVVAANLLGGPGRRVETGVVVAVEATSLTSVQGFSIKTTDGRTVDFRVGTLENGAVFPPGHLAEHRVSLVPIRVTYIDEGGGHVAVRIEDAP